MSSSVPLRCVNSSHILRPTRNDPYHLARMCAKCFCRVGGNESALADEGLYCPDPLCNINQPSPFGPIPFSPAYTLCFECFTLASAQQCPQDHDLRVERIPLTSQCDVCYTVNMSEPRQMVCLICDYVKCRDCVIKCATEGDAKAVKAAVKADLANNSAAVASLAGPPSVAGGAIGTGGDYSDADDDDENAALTDGLLNRGGGTNATNAQTAGANANGGGWMASAANFLSRRVFTPQNELHWYVVTVRKNIARSARFEASIDCSWLLQRPTRQVYFQDGALADVTSVVGNSFEIAQSCKYKEGTVLHFTLPEWFPSASSAWHAMTPYAPFPDYFNPETMGVGALNNNPLTEMYSGLFGSDQSGWTWSDKWIGHGDRRFKIMSFISTCLLTVVLLGAMWFNFFMCQLVATNNSVWGMVALWAVLGNMGMCLLLAPANYLIPRCLGDKDDNHPVAKLILVTIIYFLFAFPMGIVVGWTEAQALTGDKYLATNASVSLNCWRNPNEVLDQTRQHFVVFEEADWTVDYKTRYKQGVYTLVGTDDDDLDDGSRYNFCVAPIVYHGVPYCPQAFYAACYRETSVRFLASCNDDDARNCGWQYPAPGNLFRLMNQNEQFWSNVEDEDVSMWKSASFVATVPDHIQALPPDIPIASSLAGFYSGEGPNEIQQYVDTASNLQYAIVISTFVVSGVITFALVFATNRFFS